MISSVGINLHQFSHRARCLDDRAQICDGFTFQTTPEGLAKLEEFAWSFPREELAGKAYMLYERFRPSILSGQRGWGAKGELKLDLIRSLAKKK